MGDKPFEIVYSKKLNTGNLEVGMYLFDNTENPRLWYIDEELIEIMKEYEDAIDKKAIRGNKIIGMFLKFKWEKEIKE